MTSVQQRQKLLGLIGKACADGARLKPACRQVGLSWPQRAALAAPRCP